MDLLDVGQVAAVRQAMTDIADTFAFPITLRRTNYPTGAFAGDPGTYLVSASATVFFGAPVAGDTLTVDGTTFTKVDTNPGVDEFETISDLTALVDALATVSASHNGVEITVTAETAGTVGNTIAISKTGNSLILSGDTLAGGSEDNGIALKAIRAFASNGETDRFRNSLGPAAAHQMDLYIGWLQIEENNLIDGEDKPLLDHNDVIIMEGEVYQIVAFSGVADMTKRPTFLQIRVERRWANPNGAETV